MNSTNNPTKSTNQKVSLRTVTNQQHTDLSHMLARYLCQLNHTDNPPPYPYLKEYFVGKPHRNAFFITLDHQIIGFVLVNNHTIISRDAHSVAEFYIKPSARRQGLGQQAAQQLFNQFPGQWEIKVKADNQLGQQFWQQTISRYTHHRFQTVMLNHHRWSGPMYSFKTRN